MQRSEIEIGMKVRRKENRMNLDGTLTEGLKEPIYTVTGVNDYGDIEFTVKGGKRWACHPSYLVPHDDQAKALA